jgi:D-glycero-alpha-D-manno-heptose-7-phosphate kinase
MFNQYKMKITKKVRAPVRIDFAGGTTDIFPFTHKYGGAVLNAAINHYVYGELIATDKNTKLSYYANIPTSSGLGTSSAMNVVWVALISKLTEKSEIANSVFKIEQSVSTSKVNGKQDMYAAAFGGINLMEFKKEGVKIHPLRLKESTIKELENHLVLVYTGKSHLSGSSNKSMIDNLLRGKNTDNLVRIRDIAYKMKNALEKNNLEEFAFLMNQETNERSKLHSSIVPSRLQNIIQTGMNNGAIGAKVCGSGGGGSILFFGDKSKIKKKFGRSVIDFKFDFEGLKWL